jgi:hypothetical protein
MSFKEGQWMYNSEPDGNWCSYEYFDTIEEAVENRKNYYDCEDGRDHFFVGQIKLISPCTRVDTSRIIEDISINVYEEVGEAAEDYLWDVKSEHENILEERLNKVLRDWMDEFKYNPNFFTVDNVKRFENII